MPESPQQAACRYAEPLGDNCLVFLQPRSDRDPPRSFPGLLYQDPGNLVRNEDPDLCPGPCNSLKMGPGTLQLDNNLRSLHTCQRLVPGAAFDSLQPHGHLPVQIVRILWLPPAPKLDTLPVSLTSSACLVAPRLQSSPGTWPPRLPGPCAYTIKPFLRLSP